MSRSQQPMSIEAMLDMERQEVLALLEARAPQEPSSQERMRSASPYTPRSPMRSMLDVGDQPPSSPPSVRSMLDTSSPPPPRIRSMLDPDTPPTSSSKLPGTSTTPNSPVLTKSSLAFSGIGHTRSFSDAASNPVEFGPRASGGRIDPTAGYQFSDIITHNTGQQLPKRNTQGGKKQPGGSIGEAFRNSDLSGLQIPGDRDQRHSISGRIGGNSSKSKSPSNRLSSRSRSPGVTQTLAPGTAVLKDGRVIDINNAYRRLTDANLAHSGGSLSTLPMRKQETNQHGRLGKIYMSPDGEELGSSEEEYVYSSDDEDRGRKKAPRSLNPDAKGETAEGKEARQSLSLLAAAEEERTQVSSQQPKYEYRSLFAEPDIQITSPSGNNVKPSKGGVHPNTAYDQVSTVASANDSDEEAELDAIKTAQNLTCSMSSIMSTPESHRAIRMIYRGEYSKIAQQAEEEHHRLRKYLVATDLSDESTHALEWAIGTVLRDGDTLMAIYCVDEETGIGAGDGNQVPDDPRAMKEQAVAINTVANSRSTPSAMTAVPEFVRASIRGDSKNNTPNTSPAPSNRGERSKAEEERRRAVKGITDKVLRLLRKTSLQVRVIVEVLHCKNPKHLITEVIDLVSPTLVVIGSRGRSALKGVILGSFSNYLVTKSSAPVMVARKRLRKQGKYRGVKQVNNISNPAARSLASAKID
ncbi:usp family [Fusarium albosuccineum]|uniref:Usp family n=1 Tax=Fusarium albosuccineum TaxID=1237068 RepID=A0A8H4L0L8_9HYPO|nr:usp family [Fusarium albosuccineum]